MSEPATEELPIPPGVPDSAIPFLREKGYLQPDTLRVGDPAPDLLLYPLEGEPRLLSEWRAGRPTLLVFGSYT